MIEQQDTRAHNPVDCDCDPCNPQASPQAAPDLCDCVEDGFRASLEQWRDACSCCFSEAYPGGIDQAVKLAHKH